MNESPPSPTMEVQTASGANLATGEKAQMFSFLWFLWFKDRLSQLALDKWSIVYDFVKLNFVWMTSIHEEALHMKGPSCHECIHILNWWTKLLILKRFILKKIYK